MVDYDPATRTRTLSRIVGPYMAVMGLTLFAREGVMALMLPAFMQDGPLVLATGAFTLMAGLAILAAHHHVSSPAAGVITVIGLVTALKGAWLMIAPESGAALSADLVRAPPFMFLAAIVVGLTGLWLSYVGWLAEPSSPPGTPK